MAMDPELLALLQQYLTPEMVSSMVEAGQTDDRMKLQANAQRMAQAMRQTPMAEGTQAGRIYVAASPLEHLSVALDRIRGGQGVDQAQQAMSGLIDRRAQAMTGGWQQMIDAMRDYQG